MEHKYIEQARATLGPELLLLEQVAYDRGRKDEREGRPRLVVSTLSAPPKTETAISATATAAAKPDAVELAKRAEIYIGEQAKLGITVTNLEAVRRVYSDAGIPLQ